MNGALTIGTLDGATLEMHDVVGADNIFLFGFTAAQVAAAPRPTAVVRGHRHSRRRTLSSHHLLSSGFFAGGDSDHFGGLVKSLLEVDHFLVLDDYRSYVDAQAEAGAVYGDAREWAKRSILNTARVGYFSSDRAIREYADRISQLTPSPIPPRVSVGPFRLTRDVSRSGTRARCLPPTHCPTNAG